MHSSAVGRMALLPAVELTSSDFRLFVVGSFLTLAVVRADDDFDGSFLALVALVLPRAIVGCMEWILRVEDVDTSSSASFAASWRIFLRWRAEFLKGSPK